MGRLSTLPPLYDFCKTISISDLKRWKYLNPNQLQKGIVTFSNNGNKTGSIGIEVCTNLDSPYLEFDYKCNNEVINYRVRLVYSPSNLGKGVVWFFICPRSGMRCRKLYLIDGYFYHRSGHSEGTYQTQTLGTKDKFLVRQFDKMTKADKAKSKLQSKHFRKYYKGKPTKQYLKLLKQIKAGQGISEMDLLMS